MSRELTEKTKQIALDSGADLVGVVGVEDLAEHSEDIQKILPGAKSVVVVAAKHSLAAIQSKNIQMGQFDSIHAYNESSRAAHKTSRHLESEGFASVAVPAFIPIDMQTPKKGMRDLVHKPASAIEEILRGHGMRELWQTFMTGNYYYCFQCQAQCPATKMPQAHI